MSHLPKNWPFPGSREVKKICSWGTSKPRKPPVRNYRSTATLYFIFLNYLKISFYFQLCSFQNTVWPFKFCSVLYVCLWLWSFVVFTIGWVVVWLVDFSGDWLSKSHQHFTQLQYITLHTRREKDGPVQLTANSQRWNLVSKRAAAATAAIRHLFAFQWFFSLSLNVHIIYHKPIIRLKLCSLYVAVFFFVDAFAGFVYHFSCSPLLSLSLCLKLAISIALQCVFIWSRT